MILIWFICLVFLMKVWFWLCMQEREYAFWIERFAFILTTVPPHCYWGVWARRIAAGIFVLSNLVYTKDLIEYMIDLMESQQFFLFGSTNNPTVSSLSWSIFTNIHVHVCKLVNFSIFCTIVLQSLILNY